MGPSLLLDEPEGSPLEGSFFAGAETQLRLRAGAASRASGAASPPDGFLATGLFFSRHALTNASSSRRVVGLSVSKSISISSGLKSLIFSLDSIMLTTLVRQSPGS